MVVIYVLTSGIVGYIATSFYCQLEGTNWVRNLLPKECLFCAPLFLTFCFLNTIAIIYNATAALPFGTIMVIVLIWTLVTSPLLMLGGIVGKNSQAEFQAPCRTTKYPQEIPALPWYKSTIPHMAMAGFLPFSAIYIELYYIFASVWVGSVQHRYGSSKFKYHNEEAFRVTPTCSGVGIGNEMPGEISNVTIGGLAQLGFYNWGMNED